MNGTRVGWLLRTGDGIAPAIVRIAAGIVFMSFSLGKFTRHEAEAGAFERYGVPFADVTVYLVGLLELLGGLMLVLGVGTRLAALALALNMAVAVATAGLIDPGVVHTGLAPALLLAMLYLLWAGAGAWSVDRALMRAR